MVSWAAPPTPTLPRKGEGENGREFHHGSAESRPAVGRRRRHGRGGPGRRAHPARRVHRRPVYEGAGRLRVGGRRRAAADRLPPADLILPPLRPQKPVPQPAPHRPDRRRHDAAGVHRHPGLDGALVPAHGDGRKEQGPQGHRHGEVADPQPDAVLLRRPTGRRRRPRRPPGRRQAAGLHDLAVLRRYARPRQTDAREHRLFLLHGPQEVPDHDGRHRRVHAGPRSSR